MPTSSAKPKLERVVAELADFHGAQDGPTAKNAFDLILWEKVAYLATTNAGRLHLKLSSRA